MLEKIGTIIDKSLSTRITPLAYLFVLTGVIRGLAFTVFQDEAKSTPLTATGTVVPLTAWGVVVLASSLILLAGFFIRSVPVVFFSSALMATTWVCSAVAFAKDGEFTYLFPIAALQALIYGYFCMAALTKRLWDYAPGAVLIKDYPLLPPRRDAE